MVKKSSVARTRQATECNSDDLQRGDRSYALRRAYYAEKIDRRTQLGKRISTWEAEFAHHQGYDSLQDCPITLREKIRLVIANKLFLAMYVSTSGSATGDREIRASENLLNRILSELGLQPIEKKMLDWVAAVATVDHPSKEVQ